MLMQFHLYNFTMSLEDPEGHNRPKTKIYMSKIFTANKLIEILGEKVLKFFL